MLDNCLLCGSEKLYDIKSHFTPSVITENTFGERNKELIYTIDTEQGEISKYYGSGYPQTETTEIKPAPNVEKGIFCKECESSFGIFENEVQPKLKKIYNSLGKGVKIETTQSNIKFIEIGIHPNILATFFHSVVWRQCVKQQVENMDAVLSAPDLENLRSIVLENIRTPLNQIIEEDLTPTPKLSIITTYNTDSPKTPSYVNPNNLHTNPRIFFLGPIILLYWYQEQITDNFEAITKIEPKLLSDGLLLDNDRVCIINNGIWAKIHLKLAERVAKQFRHK